MTKAATDFTTNKMTDMKRFLPTILLSLSALAAMPDGISDVLHSIESNNLQLKALQHQQRADILDMKGGNVPSGPSVEYSPFYKNGYTGMAESELIVSEEIDFPTKYAARNRQARLQEDIHGKEYLATRRSVLLKAKLICLDIIRTNHLLQMQRRRLENSEETLRILQRRMEAGDANILELNKVKIDNKDVQTSLSTLENERTSLLWQLRQLNGDVDISLGETEFPDTPAVLDFDTFRSRLLSSDAVIMASEAGVKSSEHDVNVSRQEWLPNLTLGFRRNTEMKENVNGFLVGMAFPVLSTKSKVKAAKERLQSAQLQLQQAQQSAETTLQARYREYTTLQQILDHTDTGLMTETLSLLDKAMQQGELPVLQYYTEISSIYEKLENHINAHYQSAVIWAELTENDL